MDAIIQEANKIKPVKFDDITIIAISPESYSFNLFQICTKEAGWVGCETAETLESLGVSMKDMIEMHWNKQKADAGRYGIKIDRQEFSYPQ